MWEDFGRRRDSSPLNQPESVLVLDDVRVHKKEAFQKRLKDRHNTTTIMIPGGLTPTGDPAARLDDQQGVQAQAHSFVHGVGARPDQGRG